MERYFVIQFSITKKKISKDWDNFTNKNRNIYFCV